MTKRDGGPAFATVIPNPINPDHQPGTRWHGMTLRDYFAGQALTLFTMDADAVDRLVRGERPNHHTAATFCYEVADAMLAARAHQEGEGV